MPIFDIMLSCGICAPYLGKEMVQNISILRFGNIFIEPIFNARYIHSVQVTFKEDFGVAGRGGYFDVYGIIRDVIQNHLMQLVSLIAMEPPVNILGTNSADNIRNAKVNVLKCIQCPTLEQCIVGQYKGYLDDETIPTDSITPTFAMMELSINNPRWEGVPFIIKAGKALESRKAEIRVQFKDVAAVGYMFPGFEFPRNELVLRLQPEAVYMKLNIKKPGLGFEPVTSELDLTYENRSVMNICYCIYE